MQTPLIVLAALAVVIVVAYFVVRSRRIQNEAERPMTPPAAPIPGPAQQADAPTWLAGANAPTQAPTWSSAHSPQSTAAGTPAWGEPNALSWETQSVPMPPTGDPASSETVILPAGSGGTTSAEWDQPAGSAPAEQEFGTAAPEQEGASAPGGVPGVPAWDEPATAMPAEPAAPASAAEPAAGAPAAPAWADSAPPAEVAQPEPGSLDASAVEPAQTPDAPPLGEPAGVEEATTGTAAATSESPAPEESPLATTGWASDTPASEGEPTSGWGGGAAEPAPTSTGWSGEEPAWAGGDEQRSAPSGAPEPAQPAPLNAWETQADQGRWQPPAEEPAPAGAPQPPAAPAAELGPAPTWNEMETQSLTSPPSQAGEEPPAAPTWGEIESGGHFEPAAASAAAESTPSAESSPPADAGPQPVSAAWAPPRDAGFAPPSTPPPSDVPPGADLASSIGETMILNPLQSPAAAAPQAEIQIESGPDRGHMYRLAGQGLSLGRSPDNDLILRDPATSGHHARFERRGSQFYVVDMGSTNGTLVNGEPVQERELKHGDRVTVGQNQVKFSIV